jgi:hypothetical protein
MKSINPVYKNVFGEYLYPLGFVKSKLNNIFIRLVNGIIVQFIVLDKTHMGIPGYKGFAISGGVKSIFAESVEKEHLLFCRNSLAGYDFDQFEKLYSIPYNDETMDSAIDFALQKTIELIMPQLDKVTDLDSCIEYYKKYRPDMLSGFDRFSDDCLILIKANNHDTFMPKFQEELDRRIKQIEIGLSGESPDRAHELLYDSIDVSIAQARDKVYNDPDLYAKALIEIERRKIANLEMLRSYGVDV